MKNLTFKSFLVLTTLMISTVLYAQLPEIQYYRSNDKNGINVFETPKTNDVEFDGLKIRVGGDFAVQYQGLSQSNDSGEGTVDTLVELSNNFSLPTANLNFDVQFADGLRMHLRTYLSSRHHPEAWVKGGYFQMDNLNFISDGFMSGFMNMATLRFGMDEINYGDTHFRRSDNARAIYNPFVGNYIMDSFTTEPFGELTVQNSGVLGVVGISNGRLNQNPVAGDDGFVLYGKLGYDNQVSDDLRLRLTGSIYSSSDKGTRDYLYNGDRAGAHYYTVLEGINDARPSDFLPRFNPGFAYHTAIQVNPFVKFKGLEVFGVVEFTNNGNSDDGGGYTQLGGELIYRLGANENAYIGARYNSVSGESSDAAATQDIVRTNLALGWFLTDNVVTKIEYVTSSYSGDGWNNTKFQNAEFSGITIQAAISF